MKKLKTQTIGEIVTEDFRAAEIFKEEGIDFCCGGNQSLEQACKGNTVEFERIAGKLNELQNIPAGNAHNFKEWNLDFLCDYIVNTHHKTVLKTLPELLFYTEKIANVHGVHHSELLQISKLFSELNKELLQHLEKEEEVLFPAIKDVLKTNSISSKETIISEITRMKTEHEFAGGAMDKINEISNKYTLPADACNTFIVTFKMLQEFEDDLHIHVHLENNILYPKALSLAK